MSSVECCCYIRGFFPLCLIFVSLRALLFGSGWFSGKIMVRLIEGRAFIFSPRVSTLGQYPYLP